MGLFSKKPSQIEQDLVNISKSLKDLRLAVGNLGTTQQSIQEAIKERRKTLSKPLMYATPVTTSVLDRAKGNRVFHGPVYDLSEIARAMDVEAYVNQSVRKHREQILKEGYRFIGSDDEMVRYVKQRIFEMELASGVPFEETIRDFATSLVTFGTAFIVKKRDSARSSGRPIRMHGKTLAPIAAVYNMDPTSVTVKLNDHGHPVKWKQHIDESVSYENEKLFDNEDVVTATIDKKAGFVFGTPYILPVLDDIRALRKIEELAEILAHKHAFPSVHWKVGSENDPPEQLEDGSTEVDIVRIEIENMTPEGGVVTSHRVEHEVIAASLGTIDLQPYIKYFEERVLGGLRLSPVDLGRGDVSKASAGAVSQSLQDSAKDFQAVIENKLTYELILPLLLEGGYDITLDNMVQFSFTMINREEERAHQQHGMNMCNNSVITYTEFRQEFLGKESFSDEELKDTKDAIKHERDKELVKQQSEIKAQQQAQTAANSPSARTVQNQVTPENQSGKKPSKTAITANNSLDEEKAEYRLIVQSQETALHSSLKDSILSGLDEDKLLGLFMEHVDGAVEKASHLIDKSIQEGVAEAVRQSTSIQYYSIPKRSLDRFYKNYVQKTYRHLAKNTIKYISDNKEKFQDVNVGLSVMFSQLDDDLVYLVDRQIDIAYRFGFSKTLRSNGIEQFYFIPVEDKVCEECADKGPVEISLKEKDMPYNLLLSTHKDCVFNVSTEKIIEER